MASSNPKKLRTPSPTPSGPYINPTTPSFDVHSTLHRRPAVHLRRSRSAGCLTCLRTFSCSPCRLLKSAGLGSPSSRLPPASQPTSPRHRAAPATCRPTSSMPAPPRNAFFSEAWFPVPALKAGFKGFTAQPVRVPSRRLPVLRQVTSQDRPLQPADLTTIASIYGGLFSRSSSRACASFRLASFRHSKIMTATICGSALGAPPVQTASGQVLLLPDFAS